MTTHTCDVAVIGAGTAGSRFGIGEIHQPVFGKARRQRHIEQAALPACQHFGHTRQRL